MINFERKVFAETLRILRERKGLSQGALSKQVDMGRHSISSYETGRSLPPVDVLIDLCNILDCELNTLVFGIQHTGQTTSEKDMRLKHVTDMHDLCQKEKVLLKEFLNSLDRKNAELSEELEALKLKSQNNNPKK